MKVIEEIKRTEIVDMMNVDPNNAPCILTIKIKLTKFNDNKYEGHITVKEDSYTIESFNIHNVGKRAINNRLKIFGLSI